MVPGQNMHDRCLTDVFDDVATFCLQTEEEMAEMEADVHELDADLQAKMASLKLAHTRLEKRSGRAGVDLCRDQVCESVPAWSSCL